jgi:DNA-binding NarL/FixJ family response regulator
MPRTKILIVDDEAMIGLLLGNALETRGYEVHIAHSSAEARMRADEVNPDCFIVDVELGKGANGIDLVHVLGITHPNAGVVFLTNIPEPRLIGLKNRAIPNTAAYIHKKNLNDIDQLIVSIEAIRHSGNVLIRDDKNRQHSLTNVSAAQLAVMHMVALGLSNKEIAEQRGTTIRAVENLLRRACEAAGITAEQGSNLRVNIARKYFSAAGALQE